MFFVSHNTKDKPLARVLSLAMTTLGASIWFDEWEIAPGESIIGGIETGLQDADVLVLMWSQHAASSKWVSTELRAYLRRRVDDASLRIVPILVDSTPLPALVAEYRGLPMSRPDQAFGVARQLMGRRARTSRAALTAWLDHIELLYDDPDETGQSHIPGVFRGLSSYIGAIGPGEVCLVLGDTHGLRASLLLTFADNVIKNHQIPTVVHSATLDDATLTGRLLAMRAGVEASKMTTGRLSQGDWDRISNAIGTLANDPLHFVSNDGKDLAEVIIELREVLRDAKRNDVAEDAALRGVLVVDDGEVLVREPENLVRQLRTPLSELMTCAFIGLSSRVYHPRLYGTADFVIRLEGRERRGPGLFFEATILKNKRGPRATLWLSQDPWSGRISAAPPQGFDTDQSVE